MQNSESNNIIENYVIKQRQMFYKTRQKRGETFDQYLTNLRQLAVACQFAENENMIRDMVLFGLRDEQFKNALLNTPQLNVNQIMNQCRIKEEQTKKEKQTNAFGRAIAKNIGAEQLGLFFASITQPLISAATSKSEIVVNTCKLCQTIHPANKCPKEVNKSSAEYAKPTEPETPVDSTGPKVNKSTTEYAKPTEPETPVDSTRPEVNKSSTEYAKPTEPCKTAPPKRSKSRNRNKGTPAGSTRPGHHSSMQSEPQQGDPPHAEHNSNSDHSFDRRPSRDISRYHDTRSYRERYSPSARNFRRSNNNRGRNYEYYNNRKNPHYDTRRNYEYYNNNPRR